MEDDDLVLDFEQTIEQDGYLHSVVEEGPLPAPGQAANSREGGPSAGMSQHRCVTRSCSAQLRTPPAS